MKHLALLMIFQIGFLDCYLLRSFKQCQTQTSKEIFYASLPSSFCDKNFALPFYTPDVVGNYEPFPSPPPGGEKTIVLGAALKFDMIEYGMSMTTSDTIPLDRDVKDLREPGCKNWNYPSNLPSTSVVIAFHNEGLSVLIRTIVSVLNRSPTKVLKEIVLVDDFSNINEFPHLGSELEDWIKKTNKVRISRNKKREGLIVSKNLGVLQATGEVVIFLDAHCEVGLNWLPPLLTPILRDPATLTVPIVYPIDHTDFSSRSVYARSTKPIGIWEWGLLYKELHPVLAESQENLTSPYPSPLHAGGLIAFNKEYFLSVGGYDPGLKVWGGEQYELSFKIWMCGGRILWVPCSWVGHVYRKFVPYDFGEGVGAEHSENIVAANLRRVVETWFDEEHKEYFYTRQPMAKYFDYGNIEEQLKLRRTCKPFSWFMKEVASSVYTAYPKPSPNLEWGSIQLENDNHIYWRPKCRDPPCTIQSGLSQSDPVFRLSKDGRLGLGERCLVLEVLENGKPGLQIGFCEKGQEEKWSYDPELKSMMLTMKPEKEEEEEEEEDQNESENKDLKACVEYSGLNQNLEIKKCDGNPNQRWVWKRRI